MRRRSFFLSLASLLVIGALLGPSAAAEEAAPEHPILDATLDSMGSGRLRLRRERGHRLVVLFYEDRANVEDNDRLKRRLNAWIAEHHLEDQIVAYGVANLGDIPDAVPRMFVRAQVRPLVERWGSEILLDWSGVMRRAPWPMRTHRANVAILDRRGRLVWHTIGPVRGERSTSFFETLRYYMRH